MSDIEFTIELRDWLVEQVKFIDARIAETIEKEKRFGGFRGCFEPTEEEERDNERNATEYQALLRERRAYVAVWQKCYRELELTKFLEEVQTWLPQGQTR